MIEYRAEGLRWDHLVTCHLHARCGGRHQDV